MPAFGSNSITCAFARRILYEPVKGFRLSDRIVSALDRFIGALTRFIVPGEPGVMNRWLWIYPFVGAVDWTHSLNLADAPNAGFSSGGAGWAGSAASGKFEKFRFTWVGAVTHNDFGVTPGSGYGNTNCDMADINATQGAAWNRRSQGYYSRTNSATTEACLWASFVEPRNGYTYITGGHPRYTSGNFYGYLNYYAKTGVATTPNTIMIGVADSLGLFSDNQRGPYYGTYHYFYKRGVYIGGDNTGEVGMGYGDAGSGAWMTLNGSRNISFMFSTRHIRALEASVNSDGTGGQLPGFNPEFNFFVEQLQIGLGRNV